MCTLFWKGRVAAGLHPRSWMCSRIAVCACGRSAVAWWRFLWKTQLVNLTSCRRNLVNQYRRYTGASRTGGASRAQEARPSGQEKRKAADAHAGQVLPQRGGEAVCAHVTKLHWK